MNASTVDLMEMQNGVHAINDAPIGLTDDQIDQFCGIIELYGGTAPDHPREAYSEVLRCLEQSLREHQVDDFIAALQATDRRDFDL